MALEISYTEQELSDAGEKLISAFPDERVFIFKGDLGAGKTTLIRAICSNLGVEQGMSSPSFSIVNEYDGGEQGPIYHFDFYRFANESEAYDIGYEEYLYSDNYCFIEWPEKIENLLPNKYVRVAIQQTNMVCDLRAELC